MENTLQDNHVLPPMTHNYPPPTPSFQHTHMYFKPSLQQERTYILTPVFHGTQLPLAPTEDSFTPEMYKELCGGREHREDENE